MESPEPTPAEAAQRRPAAELTWIMNRVTLAGCLAMVFMFLTGGAQETEFVRKLGAREFHFGVIGAIPPFMLGLQFLSALAVNRLPYRKKLWIAILVVRRAMVALVALLPWFFPGGRGSALVWTFIGMSALAQCMGTLCNPIFFSWMGDLLPRSSQTEFWASRLKWLNWTSAGTMLLAAGFFYVFRTVDIRITYLVVAVVGSAAGVADILLFIRIPERRAELSPDPHLQRLIEPFRDKVFLRLIVYSAAMTFGTMIGAPFFRLFLLQEVGLGVYGVVLLFTVHSVGGTFFARSFGRVADRMGHRPVIVLCSALKSLIVLAMAAVQPGWPVLLLLPVMLFDNMLNTGLQATRTGFMLKQSPAQNRAMFVAAVLASAGLAGAAGSLAGGWLLEWLPQPGLVVLGTSLSNFRAVFVISALFRLFGFAFSLGLHEPGSESAPNLLMNVVRPAAIRWLQAPWLAVFRPGEESSGDGLSGDAT